ncbi:MAG: acetyl-CoA acetyltransferase [Chloroflexota bacterium]|nr:MAG: acetyl-CoA acetyltransferase [Chloroflexota bacterium]
MSQAVIIDAVRTPVGTFAGALSQVRPDDLAALVLKVLVERVRLDPALVEEVIMGCTNQAGEDNRNVARMALLLAGFPPSVGGVTVNRLCASGLDAIISAYRAIAAGEGDIYIAGGVESMTRAPYVLSKSETAFDRGAKIFDTSIGWRFPNPKMEALFPLEAMGETAENIYEQTHISRERQDAFALASQRRAVAAINAGRFKDEIVPVTIPQRKGEPIVVDTDEHPRMKWVSGEVKQGGGEEAGHYELATSMEILAKLKPAFRAGGTVTAGNASGINDGAAAVLLVAEERAAELGLKPLARIVTAASAGVDPRVMGYGPIPATRKALERAGLAAADLDLIELNEAFAVQALAVMDELGLPHERTNVNGGAIALGHPLGCSGARIMTTLVHEMKRRQRAGKAISPYGLATMCVGVGQGVAVIVERVDG